MVNISTRTGCSKCLYKVCLFKVLFLNYLIKFILNIDIETDYFMWVGG